MVLGAAFIAVGVAIPMGTKSARENAIAFDFAVMF